MSPRVQMYDSFEAAGLGEAWESLSANDPSAGLFTSYEWCRCWHQHLGAEVSPLILLVRDASGQPLGLAPLGIRAGRVRWLGFLGRERASGDHLGFVIAQSVNASPACIRAALWAAIRGHSERFDGLLLGELDAHGALYAEACGMARAAGHPWLLREHRTCPYIDLPGDFDAFLAGLSGNMRHQVRRRLRGLETESAGCCELVTDEAGVDPMLAAFFELHHRRWMLEGLTGNYLDTAMQAWLRAFCLAAARRGWLRAHVLRSGGAVQGVLLAFFSGGTASYYQMGWAPDSPIASPGVILLTHSIRQSIAERLGRYDFLRGDEAYKARWTSSAVQRVTLLIGCRTPARAAIAAERVKARVRGVVQRCLGQRAWQRARRVLTGACS